MTCYNLEVNFLLFLLEMAHVDMYMMNKSTAITVQLPGVTLTFLKTTP